MAEYAEREKRFNNDLPKTVGNFMMAVSMADGMARMQSVEITRQILALPNVTLKQKIDILNRDKPLVYAASLPAVTFAETRPLLAETADLEMSMNVTASTTEEKSVDSSSEGSGKATFGFGLFKAEIGIKASVSTHSSKKRKSDYSATTDMKLHMARHPLPEGLALQLDAMNAVATACNEINVALAKAEASRIGNDDAAVLPEDTPEEDQPEGNDEK